MPLVEPVEPRRYNSADGGVVIDPAANIPPILSYQTPEEAVAPFSWATLGKIALGFVLGAVTGTLAWVLIWVFSFAGFFAAVVFWIGCGCGLLAHPNLRAAGVTYLLAGPTVFGGWLVLLLMFVAWH